MRGLVILLSSYFLMIESKQLKNNGFGYFLVAQNYIEIIPLFFVLWSTFWASLDGFEISYVFYLEQAVVIFFFWMKILFFMRLFRTTGYLVYSIQAVVDEMKPFMVVLGIVVIAFGYSFLALNYACDQHESLCTPDI